MELIKMTWQETKQRIKDLEQELKFFDQEIDDCLREVEAKTSDLRARVKNRVDTIEEIVRLKEELNGSNCVC
jgi:uncharacterized coiled-coil DUF342 family protein